MGGMSTTPVRMDGSFVMQTLAPVSAMEHIEEGKRWLLVEVIPTMVTGMPRDGWGRTASGRLSRRSSSNPMSNVATGGIGSIVVLCSLGGECGA